MSSKTIFQDLMNDIADYCDTYIEWPASNCSEADVCNCSENIYYPKQLHDQFKQFLTKLFKSEIFVNNFLPSDQIYAYAMPNPGIQLEWDNPNIFIQYTLESDLVEITGFYPDFKVLIKWDADIRDINNLLSQL